MLVFILKIYVIPLNVTERTTPSSDVVFRPNNKYMGQRNTFIHLEYLGNALYIVGLSSVIFFMVVFF